MILLLACAPPAPAPVAAAPDPYAGLVALDPPRLARRLSLDLRGALPEPEALEDVEADPARLAAYRDAWMGDPLFEERLVQLLAERWHTRVETMPLGVEDFGLPAEASWAFDRAVAEEPLRLVARIVVTDRPFEEVVTADWTMADERLGAIWPVDYPEGATGWQEVRWTDGRPAAGVLVSNGLWWRYVTAPFNFNRGRAAAISRILLCEDYLLRPVTFSAGPSLLDTEGTALATREEPTCVACHASLDPIAAALFGFWPFDMYDPLELSNYHPEREPLAEESLGVEPAWFGEPVHGLGGMGAALARDPRFAACAAQTAAELLWRRDATIDDFDTLQSVRSAYAAEGSSFRAAVRAVTDTAAYRAGGFDADAGAVVDREVVVRALSPDQLARVVEDLTGFAWTANDYPQLDNDVYGYRVMAGGVDGLTALRPMREPTFTWVMVTQRLAEGGAASATARLGELSWLPGVDLATRPDDPAFAAALSTAHWQLLGARADAEWLDGLAALWTDVEAESGAEAAWQAVLSAILRDPLFVTR